ncbi:hypothetical protein JVU11DRAFT_10631 [Chiua virens]|nr:hypothetical protein JVU11DRAFT_10631 [Chiua virens]
MPSLYPTSPHLSQQPSLSAVKGGMTPLSESELNNSHPYVLFAGRHGGYRLAVFVGRSRNADEEKLVISGIAQEFSISSADK